MRKPDFFTPAELWEPVNSAGPIEVTEAGEVGERGQTVRCLLCAHYCLIPAGKAGNCGVRRNFAGELFSAVGERLAALNLDPVEKKPLFHFLPGSLTLSAGSLGCNLRCAFCQNSGLSQVPDSCRNNPALLEPGRRATATDLLAAARQHGVASLSYTYNEPTMFFELMRASAEQALKAGLRNIMVSNAYFSAECFKALDGLIQAANFDLKSFSPKFYRRLCRAELAPVLETLKRAVKSGWWVEVTTLVIGGENDGAEELDALAAFIANDLGQDVPWHVSRFFPSYLMADRPATPPQALERALECGQKRGLRYVYAGNLPGHQSESTLCPDCGAVVLARYRYRTRALGAGVCPDCGCRLAGVWE